MFLSSLLFMVTMMILSPYYVLLMIRVVFACDDDDLSEHVGCATLLYDVKVVYGNGNGRPWWRLSNLRLWWRLNKNGPKLSKIFFQEHQLVTVPSSKKNIPRFQDPSHSLVELLYFRIWDCYVWFSSPVMTFHVPFCDIICRLGRHGIWLSW